MGVNILIESDGIPILYNGHERNVETVFGFDEVDRLIQGFTFECPIFPESKLTECYHKANKNMIEKGLLFYSFRYQISFAHFCCQTMPKLGEYKELLNKDPEVKLLIPIHHFNEFVKDLLKLFEINEYQVALLEDGNVYNVKQFYHTPHYPCIPSNLTLSQLNFYRNLREKLNIKSNLEGKKRRVYLKKDGIPNNARNNSETGIMRKILNEDALISALVGKGFEIITMGEKSIFEKKELLENVEYLVTQLGANCMNLLFSTPPTNLIILSNDRTFGEMWYSNTLEALSGEKIKTVIKYYPSHLVNADPTNIWNNPFFVNIDDIFSYIKD